MKISTRMCNQTCPLIHIGQPPQMDHKVVVVMGATGAGKSRLSIDLATHFKGEIIKTKYKYTKDLTLLQTKLLKTNVVQYLTIIDPYKEFTAKSFCNMALFAINSISGREKLPIIVGGSNSLIEALVYDKTYKLCTRYDFCFLWVDVSMHILNSLLSERVDKIVDKGMVNEVRTMFNPTNSDYSKGIRKVIGVPEFDRYFRAELSKSVDEETRVELLEDVNFSYHG